MNMHAPKFLDTGRWGGLAYISEWQETMAGTLNVTDPSTGKVLAAVGLCGPADIARARMLEKAYAEAEAKGLGAKCGTRDSDRGNGSSGAAPSP